MGIEMSVRDQKVGTSYLDRVKEDCVARVLHLSPRFTNLSAPQRISEVLREALSWEGWWNFSEYL